MFAGIEMPSSQQETVENGTPGHPDPSDWAICTIDPWIDPP
jgi:hypothetical protein